MRNTAFKNQYSPELPKGIQRIIDLPHPELAVLWDSIILCEKIKIQLLSQAILNFTVRSKIDRSVIPLHGVILLVGQPGTGKTSLARGLAHRTAQSLNGSKLRLLEVEPHSLTSSALGKTQRAVSELFSQAIAEAALQGPIIVLLDEVETLVADRSKLSLEANPVDVHRATDAVLVQLDLLAERFPHLLFVATSNFPRALDSAFISRCDLVLNIPLPEKEECRQILRHCLSGLGKVFHEIGKLNNSPEFDECAAACVGLDGRTIRKIVVNGLARQTDTAINPNLLNITDLIEAAKAANNARNNEKGTPYDHSC